MATLRRAAFTDVGTLLFVNAGLDASKPLDLQGDAFWWGGGPFLEFAEPYESYRRVVRGFDRRHGGIVESRYAVSLDGGCGFGGRLVAACFDNDGVIVDRLDA
jgi:serine/threonine protein phosphatase 1